MARQHRPYLAVIYILTATVFFCLADVLGKWLTERYPVVQVTWLRSVAGLLALIIAISATANLSKLKTRRPGWHGLRSLMSATVVLLIFYGLKHIPLAEFVSLTFSIPFFIAIFSPWLLKEPVSSRSWIAIAAGFVGVLLILRPTPGHFHLAHLTTLFLSFLVGLMIITARYLSTTENNWSLNFYLSIASVILFLPWALGNWAAPARWDWLLFFLLGLSQTAALACYIEAMRRAQPAVVAPLDYVRLIWTIAAGYFLWREIPDPYTWAGIAIIVASGIYVARQGRAAGTVFAPRAVAKTD